MPIEHAVWKIDDKPQRLQTVTLASEQLLEEQICRDVSILNDGWMLIGRQVRTDYDRRIDLLAIDASGSLIIIELERDKTLRFIFLVLGGKHSFVFLLPHFFN